MEADGMLCWVRRMNPDLFLRICLTERGIEVSIQQRDATRWRVKRCHNHHRKSYVRLARKFSLDRLTLSAQRETILRTTTVESEFVWRL